MIKSLLVVIALLGTAIDASAQDALSEALFGYRHDTSPALETPSADPMSLALPALGAEESPCDGAPIEGEFLLDRDIACSVTLGEGATLDLNGFTIEGYVRAVGTNATIRNGTIIRAGIDFDQCAECTIENLRVIEGQGNFVVQPGPSNRITGCFFSGNPAVAVDLFNAGDSSTIEDSTFENNSIGINIARDKFTIVSRNSFRDNTVGVRLFDENSAASYNTIVGNHFSGNELGVYFNRGGDCRYPSVDCLEGNRILRNEFVGNGGSGVLFDGTRCEDPDFNCGDPSASIKDNVFRINGFSPPGYQPIANDGISVLGPTNAVDGVAVAHNLSVANNDLGIEAPGATDGGGNRASGNGNPLQCVGVACRPAGQCRDGIDNDGDGRTDFRIDGSGDLGCKKPTSATESPKCQDGLDNDNDGKIDFDGGASVNGGAPLAPPDSAQCKKPWSNREAPDCGRGAELALVMPLLGLAASRRRRASWRNPEPARSRRA